jgi:hypothetical protein
MIPDECHIRTGHGSGTGAYIERVGDKIFRNAGIHVQVHQDVLHMVVDIGLYG